MARSRTSAPAAAEGNKKGGARSAALPWKPKRCTGRSRPSRHGRSKERWPKSRQPPLRRLLPSRQPGKRRRHAFVLKPQLPGAGRATPNRSSQPGAALALLTTLRPCREALMAKKSLADDLARADCAKYVELDRALLPEVFATNASKWEQLHPKGGCPGLQVGSPAGQPACSSVAHSSTEGRFCDTGGAGSHKLECRDVARVHAGAAGGRDEQAAPPDLLDGAPVLGEEHCPCSPRQCAAGSRLAGEDWTASAPSAAAFV